MKRITLICTILTVLSMSIAHAKRPVPDEVDPIKSGDMEYRAPHDQMGCVEAWDTTQNELIWRRQIYVVKYRTDRERDVQDVFITAIELDNTNLIAKNERGSEYELDLESFKVNVLKGSLLEYLK